METHGLPPRPTDGDQPPPLADGPPALRVTMRDRTVAAVNDGMVSLIGRGVEEILGTALSDLWAPQERAAIDSRFDDVVFLGHDAFGAVALQNENHTLTLVEVDACYLYVGGQRLEVTMTPLVDERADEPTVEPLDEPTDGPTDEPTDEPVDEPAVDDDRHDDAEIVAAVALQVEPEVEPLDEPADGPVDEPAVAAAESDEVPTDEPTDQPVDEPADQPAAQTNGEHTAELAAATVMSALEAAGAPALWVDADGIVVSATRGAARELGVEVADVRGRTLLDVIVLDEPARDALSVARESGMRGTVLGSGDDSEPGQFVEWVPGADPMAGFVVFATPGSTTDTGNTERLRFQAQLVSHVSHDLRGAMTAVFCGLQVISDGLPDGDPLHESVNQALDDSRRANRIIDEVLAVSRPARQKRADIDLAELLNRTLDHHRAFAASNGISVVARLDHELHVSGDRTALDRAFSNVIENGMLATPEGGSLTVSIEPETRAGDGVHVTITDTGSGIPPELQPNIFEPFVSNREGGSGLGLAITRRVVLKHDGQIDFETEEGVGTSFHFWLPCAHYEP